MDEHLLLCELHGEVLALLEGSDAQEPFLKYYGKKGTKKKPRGKNIILTYFLTQSGFDSFFNLSVSR